MGASWPNSNGRSTSRPVLSRGRAMCPSVVILDSHSVKTTERGGLRGFDGHKRVNGRKRHLVVDTLGMVVARSVEAAHVSDQRVGARLLTGLGSGFPRLRTVMADAGYQSGKLARELKRRHRWRLQITQRRQRAFKVTGLSLDRGAHVGLVGPKPSVEQRLRVERPDVGSLHRLGGHPAHAQTARPEVKLLKHPLSPSAEGLPERTSPELADLETKFAALVSYGLTLKRLKDLLPSGQHLSVTALQNQVSQKAERLEAERGKGQETFLEACPHEGGALLKSAAPLIIGLDGVYVHAKGRRSRTEGWFEVIVGKSLPTGDRVSKCFGLVSRYDSNPLTTIGRLTKAVRADDQPDLSADLEEILERLKGNLWHGKVPRALELLDELAYALDGVGASAEHRKLLESGAGVRDLRY